MTIVLSRLEPHREFVGYHFSSRVRLGKHYESKEKIMNRILEPWAPSKQQTLVNIAQSHSNRIVAALQVRGKQTKYLARHVIQ